VAASALQPKSPAASGRIASASFFIAQARPDFIMACRLRSAFTTESPAVVRQGRRAKNRSANIVVTMIPIDRKATGRSRINPIISLVIPTAGL